MSRTMRTVFLLLVLANVAFFGWSRYLAPAREAPAAPPANEADKLPIVPPPASSAAPAQVASATCLEWGLFTITEKARAEKALEPLALGERLAERRSREVGGWWVYIPPQESREAALRKAAELRALGVRDIQVMSNNGALRWSLSLGVFSSVDAAQSRLASLRGQGVRGAIIAPRDTVVPFIALQLKNVDAAQAARLQEIAREIEGSEIRPCPA
jgi:hypothetical protein